MFIIDKKDNITYPVLVAEKTGYADENGLVTHVYLLGSKSRAYGFSPAWCWVTIAPSRVTYAKEDFDIGLFISASEKRSHISDLPYPYYYWINSRDFYDRYELTQGISNADLLNLFSDTEEE
jgi:hypothetical protein